MRASSPMRWVRSMSASMASISAGSLMRSATVANQGWLEGSGWVSGVELALSQRAARTTSSGFWLARKMAVMMRSG